MKAGKIWGQTELIHANGVLEFHRIEFKKNVACSKHQHQFKWNGFYVESGKMLVRVWQKDYDLVDETILNAGDFISKDEKKFLGQVQAKYEKKNWSSFMLLNCKKCTTLTPDYVNKASGLELHQYKWLESEDLIGDIPLEWNWLVGEYEHKEDVKNVHFTEGGPWFDDYKNCDYSKDWFANYKESNEPFTS